MKADSLLRARIQNSPTLMDFESWLQQKISQRDEANMRRGGIFTIPVVVHVIHNGDAVGSNENISQAQVISQIDVLNEDFRRLNTDASNTPPAFVPVAADCEVEFCLAQIDPNGNIMPEPGIDRVNAGQSSWSSTTDIDNNLKPSTIWDPTRYFNIWTVNFGGGSLLGYAQFPSGSGLPGLGGGAANTDGIVIRYDAFGRVGNVTYPFDLGRTATHETGHWLGLRHIWGDGDCSADDYCNDTPLSDAANYGCQTTTVSCGSTDMVQNYMDYSDDACMNIFTQDQKTRIVTVLQNSPRRAELANSQVCQTMTIAGKVRDAATLQGIANAKVRITGDAQLYRTTDANGNFTVNLYPGTFNLYGGQWGYITNELANQTYSQSTSNIFIDLNKGYYDDFILDFNWTESGNAGTGSWVRGEPIGTTYNGANSNPGNDVSGDYGSDCYVTGNGGGQAGTDDVDDGNTVLTSPAFDLSAYNDPYISYYRWFYNAGGTGTPNDNLQVRLNNGNTTVTVETLDVNTANSNQWNFFKFRVADYIAPTANMQIIFETADQASSGHIVEAALDLFRVTDSISQNAPPIALFNANTVTGCSGTSINFSDASSNTPGSWQWSFPGGSPASSSQQNPTVTYNAPGNYSVTLIATNAYGSDTLIQPNFINITGVQADFSADVQSGCPGLVVSFSDLSTCGATSWSWSFPGGNPSSSNSQNPVVTYNSVGNYNVTLTVSNAGSSHTLTQNNYIHVTLGNPVSVLSEDFESGNFTTNAWTIANPDGGATWEISTVNGSVTGSKAARVHLYTYNSVNQRDGLISPALNLSAVGNANLSFEHAHRRRSATQRDSLIIYVSTDGGLTFPNRIFAAGEDGTGSFATNGIIGNVDFVPTNADDWCFSGGLGASCFSVDLSAYDGYPSVKLKFETVNDNGNNIYIDNIMVDGVCTAPSQPPVAIFTANNNTGCGPLTVTFSDQSVSSPTSWSWFFPGGSPSFSGSQNPVIIYNTPGSYNVTLIASSSFGSDTSVMNGLITVYSNPVAAITGSNVNCFGGSSGFATVTVTGGTSPYTFQWSNGASSQSISSLNAGAYIVTVTEQHSCQGLDTISITQPPALMLNVSATDEYCGNSNGTASVSVSGGTPNYYYSWSSGSSQSSISSLSSGNFTVTVSDAKGCSKNASVAVAANNVLPVLSMSVTPISCFGGMDGAIDVTVTGNAPFDYNWSNLETSASLSGLGAGSYSVSVEDANGCSASNQATVSEPQEIIISGNVTDATCGNSNGEVISSVSGGHPPYLFSWNNSATVSSINALVSGTYSLTVNDSNGCAQTESFNVSNVGGPVLTFSKVDVTCNGGNNGSATVAINGGSPPYNINWSTGSTVTGVNNLTAGNYNVTVTDGNSCMTLGSVTISQPVPLNISFAVGNAACGNANGRAQANVSGGNGSYSYSWSNGSTNMTLSGVPAGNYGVTVMDGMGCMKSASATIGNSAGPSLSVTATPVTCNGGSDGSANASATGGKPPYNYQWSIGLTSKSANNLSVGTYIVTVTDSNGCEDIDSIIVTEPAQLTVQSVIMDATCGGQDGSIDATASGGNPPYYFLWSTGQISSFITGLSSGNFDLTLSDGNGCYWDTSLTVNDLGGPSLGFQISDVACYGLNDGAITSIVTGGTSPYAFNWDNGASNPDLTAIGAGTFSLTVTDFNGCKTIGNATVNEPFPLALHLDVEDLVCRDKIGSIMANAVGGTPPYDYQWSNGISGAINSTVVEGIYSVTVSDSNGCSISDSATVSVISDLEISVSSTPDSFGSGTASVMIISGAPPFTYLWNDPAAQNTATATHLTAGDYVVIVKDSNGCEVRDTVTVDSATGIFTPATTDSWRIYPNPTNGQFIIELSNFAERKSRLQIFDAVGKLILDRTLFNERKIEIDLTKFGEGIFLVRMEDEKAIWTKKVFYNSSY